jgi:hypothetical protein
MPLTSAIVAFVIIAVAGIWLVAVALLMALRPIYCLKLFEKMTKNLEASSWRLQLTEQGLRVLAGVSLIVRSPASKLPLAFEVAGWVLVGSSLLVLVLPIGWHGKYGSFWLQRLTPWVIRALSPVPALTGAGLIYAAV